MHITLEDLEAKLLEERLVTLFQQAYEQGVRDGREKYHPKPNMKKQDVADYFQVELPTVEKIIRMEGFPKSKVVSARYPRDEVIEWAKKNTERVNYYRNAI